MEKIRTKKTKYPWKVVFNNGNTSPIPNQYKFKTEFIRKHGCSLCAFYIANRYIGRKDKIGQLLSYSKHSLSKYIKAKITIKGVAVGLNRKANRKVAYYHRTCSKKAVNKALDNGCLVLLETGKPIHTNVLYRANDRTYHLDHGKVKKVNADKLINKATKSSTYRGWVEVRG